MYTIARTKIRRQFDGIFIWIILEMVLRDGIAAIPSLTKR